MTFQYQGGVKMEDVEDRRASTPPGLIRRGWKKDKEASRSGLWQSHLPAVLCTRFSTLQARVQGCIMLIEGTTSWAEKDDRMLDVPLPLRLHEDSTGQSSPCIPAMQGWRSLRG